MKVLWIALGAVSLVLISRPRWSIRDRRTFFEIPWVGTPFRR